MSTMLRRRVTILLIGLFFFSTISGIGSVLCYGSDGHIALEPAVHHHCDCAGEDSSHHSEDMIIAAEGHGHCVDVAVGVDALISVEKSIRFSVVEVLKANPLLPSFSFQNASTIKSGTVDSEPLPSFFGPLGVIILLA